MDGNHELKMEIINIQKKDLAKNIPLTITAIAEGKATYNNSKKCYVMDVNESPVKECWRCVHKNSVVLDLEETNGTTGTLWDLFCGTGVEVRTEIEKLKLKMPEDIQEVYDGMKSTGVMGAMSERHTD